MNIRTQLATKVINNIKSITDIKSWSDDHIICVNVTIDNHKISLWWCGSEILSSLTYFDSKQAKLDLITYFTGKIQESCEVVMEYVEYMKKHSVTIEEVCEDLEEYQNSRIVLQLFGISSTDIDELTKYSNTEE